MSGKETARGLCERMVDALGISETNCKAGTDNGKMGDGL